MARSVDQVVRDTIGNQAITIIQLQAALEEAQEKLAALTPKEEAPEK